MAAREHVIAMVVANRQGPSFGGAQPVVPVRPAVKPSGRRRRKARPGPGCGKCSVPRTGPGGPPLARRLSDDKPKPSDHVDLTQANRPPRDPVPFRRRRIDIDLVVQVVPFVQTSVGPALK